VLSLAAAVALLALGVSAQTTPGCDCGTNDVWCFTNLDSCVAGINPLSFPSGSNVDCKGLNPRQTVYACSNTPKTCQEVSTCAVTVPAAKKCQCRKDIKCFPTLQDCRTDKHGYSPHVTNSNQDCLNLSPPDPYYVCWEENFICRSSRTCRIIPGGNGTQDPHFKGFDGSSYYFDGEAGLDYNIITDAGIQVNAHFIRLNALKGTYMGRLGVRFGEYSLTFDPTFGLFFNGSLLTNSQVELDNAAFSIERSAGNRFRFVFQDETWMLVASVAVEKGETGEAYINLQASLLGDVTDPHGILGQTARFIATGTAPNPDTFEVEGAETDYIVLDGIVGTNFPVNRFVGTTQTANVVTATGSRLRRAVKPRFEAASG